MTTLFDRIKNAIMTDLHDCLDKKENKNPVALLNQYLRESENETKKVEKLIERQYMLTEEFQRELKQVKFMAEKRSKQAEIALKANEYSLHEMAIAEEAQYKEQALTLQEAYNNAATQLEELEKKHREMKLRLKDMNIKRMELMGRENVLKIKEKMNYVLDDTIVGKAVSRFEETQKYMDHLESRMNKSYEKSIFDSRISELEKDLKNNETAITD